VHHNIMRVWGNATERDLNEGMEWYSTAHTFCRGLVGRYGITIEQAAGVTAAISPLLSWEKNLLFADTLVQTGDAPCLKRNVRKAQAILEGVDPLDVLGGHKVRSFYDNILQPDTSNEVTIDRHAFDVAVGCVTNDQLRKQLDRKGMYRAFAQLYRDAAADLGVMAHQVQAVTWSAWRRTKVYDRPQHVTLYQVPLLTP
jgi:hypothetical protein